MRIATYKRVEAGYLVRRTLGTGAVVSNIVPVDQFAKLIWALRVLEIWFIPEDLV